MKKFIINLIIVIGILYLTVFIHEGFHYLTARISEVEVSNVEVGCGKELVTIQGDVTKFQLNLIPLNGKNTLYITKDNYYKIKNHLIMILLSGTIGNLLLICVASLIFFLCKPENEYIKDILILCILINCIAVFDNMIINFGCNDRTILNSILNDSILDKMKE